ncbi:MAG: family metallopeptidase [Naasia sp.]|nr:family metallopeptidase [Naasia sp.]
MAALVVWTAGVALLAGAAAAASPRWDWPARGSLGEPYRAPPTPYAAGHRGIDIAVAAGTAVLAPADGVVSFAGPVGGRPVLALSHDDGILSSFDPVEATVRTGERVLRGQPVAVVAVSAGHCGADCLHLGARSDGRYLSPLALLGGVPRAVLLPLDDQARG